MKKLIGLLSILATLIIAVFSILKIWGINIFTTEEYKKIGITTMIVCFVVVVFIVLYSYFFKDSTNGYSVKKGKVSSKKID